MTKVEIGTNLTFYEGEAQLSDELAELMQLPSQKFVLDDTWLEHEYAKSVNDLDKYDRMMDQQSTSPSSADIWDRMLRRSVARTLCRQEILIQAAGFFIAYSFNELLQQSEQATKSTSNI